MSHLSSGTVSNMIEAERVLVCAMRLNWSVPPSGYAWDSFAGSPGGALIRWLLFPFLEPSVRPSGPYTVYCDAGPNEGKTASETEVADACGSLTAVARGQDESDHDYMGRTLQTESVN